MISFRVHGEPKGQPRPRAFAMKLGNGKYSARVFDAGTAEAWKSLIAYEAIKHRPDELITGAVFVRMVFVFGRPKKHFVANNPARGLREDAPAFHVSKPDNDNLQKGVLDALTQLGGFWSDDAQVARIESFKIYAELIGPGVQVEIEQLERAKAA